MAATAVWDETEPDGSELASALDNIIRDLKRDIRERMEAGGIPWGVSQAADGVGPLSFTPAYDGTHFRAAAGTWTVQSGDVITYSATLIGDLMILRVHIAGASTSGAGSAQLVIDVPGGYTIAEEVWVNAVRAFDAGIATTAFIVAQPGATWVAINGNASEWHDSTNNMTIIFSIAFKVTL